MSSLLRNIAPKRHQNKKNQLIEINDTYYYIFQVFATLIVWIYWQSRYPFSHVQYIHTCFLPLLPLQKYCWHGAFVLQTHFRVFILMHGSVYSTNNGIHTTLFHFYSPCSFLWSNDHYLWRHRQVCVEIGGVEFNSPDFPTQSNKTTNNNWPLKCP